MELSPDLELGFAGCLTAGTLIRTIMIRRNELLEKIVVNGSEVSKMTDKLSSAEEAKMMVRVKMY